MNDSPESAAPPPEGEALEQAILALVSQPGYKPVKPRGLVKKLKLPEDARETVRRTVKRLIKRGVLEWGPSHQVKLVGAPAKPAARDEKHLQGVFRRSDRGFGFVRPDGASSNRELGEDIYIAENKAGDAATGDVVQVRLTGKRAMRNLRDGVIVKVVERQTHQFVGSYFESADAAYVQVDGKLFSQPIAVGDPGAKNAQPDDKVVIEMVRFPSHAHDGEGVIVEVLGARGAPGVDTLSILREFNLPDLFAEDAQEEARRQVERFDEAIPPGRVDFTRDTVITIDPVDARDFDDAISLVRLDNGHWKLGVHIADVSHFVEPDTPLDREAKNRATSVYLPDRVVPMLPELISNGLASLQPDRVRYTKTATIEFTADGAHVATDLVSGAIKSARRFTYEEVDEYLADPTAWKKKLDPAVYALLGRMHELAMILRQRRNRRGSLELSLSEVKVDLDRDGRVTGAHRVENTVSHQIIEEFMLAANEAVALRLQQAGVPFLRRVHDNPDLRKLKQLTDFVHELGLSTDSLESRFEMQKLLARVHGKPEEQAVNYALLRSLQRAVYSPREEGHYALASECYCHFTSPIRRYPDLTIHRLIDALLTKKKPPRDVKVLTALGQHCSEREQRAESAERELTRVKLLDFLSHRIGEELDGVITGVESFGLFVQGLELPADGLVHVSSLNDDYYHFDRTTHSLSGHRAGNAFRLGDMVRVAVAHVDVERRSLDFRLVSRGKAAPRPKAADPSTKQAKPRAAGGKAGKTKPAKPKPSRAKPKRKK